jgi:hypothetical protein
LCHLCLSLVFVRRWTIPAVLALTACGGGREVQIEVAIPGPDSVDAPVAHLQLVALPYDRDSLLTSFEQHSPRPARETRQLDSLFAAFRKPFSAYAAAAYRLQSLQRSLGYLKARLDSLPRQSPTYDSLYRAFASGSDSMAAAKLRRDDLQRELSLARVKLAPRIDSLRQLMARWEDSTYRGYDSITKVLGSGIGREPISDSTGRDGKVTLRLPRGSWWIYARSWDAWDPYSEWYWNVPATGEHLVLDRSNGRRLPRY